MVRVVFEINISIDLPDDEFERAELLAGLKQPLETFVKALPDRHELTARAVKRRPEAATQPVKSPAKRAQAAE